MMCSPLHQASSYPGPGPGLGPEERLVLPVGTEALTSLSQVKLPLVSLDHQPTGQGTGTTRSVLSETMCHIELRGRHPTDLHQGHGFPKTL